MNFWGNKNVFITGHTGFKGSWLTAWLNKLGANITGYALEPSTNPNIFSALNLDKKINSIIGDIRDKDKLNEAVRKSSPEIVFHLAAQPIVRKSYLNPVETFETNIIGTVNLFDILNSINGIKVIINVTSDKCYENKEWEWGYRESDALGGYDPYSASKGCSEIVTKSFRQSFFKDKGVYLATARAGNVIGGGDWAEDRIIPDCIKALARGDMPTIRNPYAVRPWQHVLEPLSGYMKLAEVLYNEGEGYAEAWNFGPKDDAIINVADITNKVLKSWGVNGSLSTSTGKSKLHEANILKLDSSKARCKLGWNTKLDIDQTVNWTIEWYKRYYNNEDIMQFTLEQIKQYESLKR